MNQRMNENENGIIYEEKKIKIYFLEETTVITELRQMARTFE